MEHDLVLEGPVVSPVPLVRDHAAGWARLADAGLYAFHTSSPPMTVRAARDNIQLFLDSPVTMGLRCDAENKRSADAIVRLGGRYEGTFRAHRRRHDGALGDTTYFSITATEWPSVRRGLLHRIDSAEPW